MRLLEYESKRLLRAFAVPVPTEVLVLREESKEKPSAFPVVVKSQVPAGGRGKAGGIKIVHDSNEYQAAREAIFAQEIKGYKPNTILVEEAVDVVNELYLSFIINREVAAIELIAHQEGGVEVESHDSAEFRKYTIKNGGIDDAAIDELADVFNIPEKAFLLGDIIQQLYETFVKSDATLLEINPLFLTHDGQFIAGDCKIVLDDAALFRHPDWSFEDKPHDANFILLNEFGSVATIANGAGLAMATVDAVVAAGLTPSNFLDIGGSATTEQIVESFKKILKFKNVDTIIINIFGGIVQCDTVAKAIIDSQKQFSSLPRLLIRLSGNRSEEAAKLLSQSQLHLYQSLNECLKELAP